MAQPPVYFGHPYPPEVERVHRSAMEQIAKLLPHLGLGESLGARWIMTRDGLIVEIEPKRIKVA